MLICSLLVLALCASAQSPPASFASVAKRAQQARLANRVPEAIRLYRQAVSLRPDWVEGRWYLATLLYDRDRFPEARAAFRQFLARAPESGPGHALLGLCLFHTREYEPALRSLYRAQELHFGDNPAVRDTAEVHLVLLLTRFSRFEEALELLARYADRPGDRPPPIEAAGLAALRRPLLPEEVPPQDREFVLAVGQAVWDTFSRHAAAAQERYRALVARYPAAPYLHFLYGSFLLRTRPDEGRAELERELEIAPHSVPALVQLAASYLAAGEPATARPYAEKAVASGPRSFAAHAILGRIWLMTGNTEAARKEIEAARDLAPGSPDVRYALAEVYRSEGRAADAAREMAEFERLKSASPQR